MLQLKIALRLASLGQPFREALDTAARLGVEAVEIDARHDLKLSEMSRTAVRQIRKWLDDRKLKVSSVSFTTRRGYHVADELDRRLDATRLAMNLAYDLGARVVRNTVGEVAEEGTGESWNLLVHALQDLARHGLKSGAVLAATTQGVSPQGLRRLIDHVPAGGLMVDFDPAAMVCDRIDPAAMMEHVGNWIACFQARDAVWDVSRRGGVEVQLGRGVVDLPDLLARLEEKQYGGYLLLRRDDSEDAVFELGQGVEYLRALWR